MDADQSFAGDSEHVEGIIVAQVGFHREWEMAEIRQLPKILGMHAGFVEGASVVRDILVGVPQRPGQALGLQRGDLVAGGPLRLVHLGAVAAFPGSKVGRSHRAFP